MEKNNMSARNVVTHNMKVINFRQQAVIFKNLRCTEQEIYHGFLHSLRLY